ncbi:hypothetical protein BH11BAC5_BH11BAC5_12470 [soil metagenome]
MEAEDEMHTELTALSDFNYIGPMIIENALKVKNYKCFGDVPQGFERICPVNIIIGKNNAGKSSLIDLIEFAVNRDRDILETQSSISRAVIELKLSDEILTKVGELEARNNGFEDPTPMIRMVKDHAENSVLNHEISFELKTKHQINFISNKNDYGQFLDSYKSVFSSLFRYKTFKRINAERNIVPELFFTNDGVNSNGDGATNLIWKHLSKKGFDQNLIKKELLESLNDIIKPDIVFIDIIIKEENKEENQHVLREIYFEVKNGTWVALSKMGSGVKTIILVLLNLIVIPKFTNTNKNQLVFGLEELENNLHPSLLRRLFNYIAQYSKLYKSYFFITTHSSIVIDLFSSNNDAQIVYIENSIDGSICRTINSYLDNKNVLKDLDYKPSDLLLSNGIIWVEGPSDVIYLELLIDLFKTKFSDISKMNYCIQSLSTAIWKYAGFLDFDWSEMGGLENKIISLSKINHNHVIVLDRDNDYEDERPSNWELFKNGTGRNKGRLINESLKFSNHNEELLISNWGDTKNDTLYFWINEGTFETYLEFFIRNKGVEFEKYFSPEKGNKYFEKKRVGTNSSKSKVELAAEIAQFILKSKLSIYDIAPADSNLFNKIKRLVETIKSWN